MTNNDIYDILASKPHNPHYLKRYFKFIQWCKENPTKEDYTEKHHISPKSDDLFPEYISFVLYEWNCIVLSARQHILAHILLWKSYGGKSVLPVNYMLNVQNSETGYSDRKLPTAIQIRYAASAKSGFGEWRKGKSTFKDSEGNKYFLKTTDPLIEELGLVGNNSGHNHSEESKQKMSETKLPNKVVKIFKLDQKKTIKLYSQEFADHINDGWNTELTDDDREYIQSQSNQKLSDFWTNRMRYMDSTGTYHGSYLKDDPIIQELNLVPLRTQSQIDQNASRTDLATAAKLGTKIYNNGLEERFLVAPIDDSWVLGRLPYSKEGMKNRADGLRTAILGATTYNDGKRNYFIKEGDFIDPSWVKGMAPQKEREHKYTDGITIIKCTKNNVPSGFVQLRHFKK
jgi:hypothetical protein